jgi:hypothetical protein
MGGNYRESSGKVTYRNLLKPAFYPEQRGKKKRAMPFFGTARSDIGLRVGVT